MILLIVRYVTLQAVSLAAPRWILRRAYDPSIELERKMEAVLRNQARLATHKAKWAQLTPEDK